MMTFEGPTERMMNSSASSLPLAHSWPMGHGMQARDGDLPNVSVDFKPFQRLFWWWVPATEINRPRNATSTRFAAASSHPAPDRSRWLPVLSGEQP